MKDLKNILIPKLLLDFQNPSANFPEISVRRATILYQLYKQIKHLNNDDKAQQLLRQWLLKSFGNKLNVDPYCAFRNSIIKARDFREGLIREYIPDILKFNFTSEGIVRATSDPVQILKMCFEPVGDPNYKVIRSFEALSLWELGQRFLLMELSNEYIRAEEHLSKITLWLEENLFSDGEEALRNDVLKITYNPKDKYRFSTLSDQNLPSIDYPVTFRIINIHDQKIRVLYDGRDKREDDIFRKTLLQSKGEFPVVFDQRAISLIFLTLADLNFTRTYIEEEIFSNGAMRFNWRINGQGGKKNNNFSSNFYAPIEQFIVYHLGGLLEVRINTLEKYFNEKFSLGEESHKFYRLNQVLPILELLFPVELFKTNWKDEAIITRLKNLQKLKILSNFDNFDK